MGNALVVVSRAGLNNRLKENSTRLRIFGCCEVAFSHQ